MVLPEIYQQYKKQAIVLYSRSIECTTVGSEYQFFFQDYLNVELTFFMSGTCNFINHYKTIPLL